MGPESWRKLVKVNFTPWGGCIYLISWSLSWEVEGDGDVKEWGVISQVQGDQEERGWGPVSIGVSEAYHQGEGQGDKVWKKEGKMWGKKSAFILTYIRGGGCIDIDGGAYIYKHTPLYILKQKNIYMAYKIYNIAKLSGV